MLAMYLGLSLVVLAALRWHRGFVGRLSPLVHVLDLAYAVALMHLTAGLASPVLAFPLVSAACQWGRRETLATAAVAAVAVAGSVASGAAGPAPTAVAIGAFVAGCLAIVALPLARAAEQKERLRAEAAAITETTGKIRVEDGFTGTLDLVLKDLLRLFGARRAILVAHEHGSGPLRFKGQDRRRSERPGRLIKWEAALRPDADELPLRASELDVAERENYFFTAPPGSWYAAEPTGGEGGHQALAAPEDGSELRTVPLTLPPAFVEAHPFRSMLAVSSCFGEEWDDRLFLLDPHAGPTELRFLTTIVKQLGPIVCTVYLLGRLQSQITAEERARVARELHDGITQSLIGLEMQIEAWRRESAAGSPAAEKLSHVQRLLREDILSLRELMDQMKPLHLDPGQLLDFVSEALGRFQRETGIHTHFVSDVDEVTAPAQVCSELGRIVQEALVNVRRHSGAATVLVRIGRDDGHWSLVIDDDGRGFPFAGTYSQAELDAGRKGPVVIKERVRSIGGELTIESRPGQGTRLQITVPSNC